MSPAGGLSLTAGDMIESETGGERHTGAVARSQPFTYMTGWLSQNANDFSARVCEVYGPRPFRNLYGCAVDQPFEMMNFPSDSFQFFVVASC